jgi:hypothetical protein
MGFKITQKLETGLECQHENLRTDQIRGVPWIRTAPGGWFGVAMGYFPSADRILDSKSLRDYGEDWLKDIDNVVNQFHAQGYVHGDLVLLILLLTVTAPIKINMRRFVYSMVHDKTMGYTKRLISDEIEQARLQIESKQYSTPPIVSCILLEHDGPSNG